MINMPIRFIIFDFCYDYTCTLIQNELIRTTKKFLSGYLLLPDEELELPEEELEDETEEEPDDTELLETDPEDPLLNEDLLLDEFNDPDDNDRFSTLLLVGTVYVPEEVPDLICPVEIDERELPLLIIFWFVFVLLWFTFIFDLLLIIALLF